jgi:arylsulfatase A-like enzyme
MWTLAIRTLRTSRLLAAGLVIAGLLLACRGRGAQSAEVKTGQPVPATPTPASPASPTLDEAGPKMDLVASRALWHLYQQGLVIPFASEGFRKYSQEYTNPWRGIVKLDERVGRSLGSTAATLRFPWNETPSGEATLIVRVHGGSAGKKLSIRLNGKPVKNATLESGWQQVLVPVSERVLVKGENTLAIAVGKKGAVFHSIDVVGDKIAAAPEAWPPATPVAKVHWAGKERVALTGFARMMLPIEVPHDGWLVLETGSTTAPVRFQVSVTAEDQPAKTILDEQQAPGGPRERRLSLSAFSGKLVALELAVREGRPSDALWLAPRIVLPAAKTAKRPAPARNLIVVVADALRADKLPMYAESRVRTPGIVKAAQTSGVTFTSTQAASPSSPPSHASIQSGCMPRSHGILGDKSKVNPGTPMVSAILAKAGLATDFVGDASFAMNRLKPASTWTEFHMPNAEGKGGDCSAVVKQILAFADKQEGKRFFISSVAFEAHTPYIYHEDTTPHYYDGAFDEAIGKHPDGVILTAIVGGKLKMTPERWGQLKGLYDGEVEHLDGCLVSLFDGLKSRGLLDNTPVVLLADHGEGFLEHGSMGHAYGQYAELTNVPLVFFAPGIGHGQKISTVVSHTDVVPTILDLLGVQPDERVQGESLIPMILRDGPWVPRVMPSEYGRSFSLRAQGLHYIVDYSGDESLYDIAADPLEKSEIKDKRPLALRYFRDLAGIYLAHRAKWHVASWGTLNNHAPGFVAATGE